MARVALDFDGTLVESQWPGIGPWLPGAISAVSELLAAGHTCYIFSSRVSPYWLDGTERNPAEVEQMIREVRERLDSAGLQEVDIFTGLGKPQWDLLIDDKCERFTGRWKVTLAKTLMRVDKNAEALRRLVGIEVDGV
jgi:hypothetical protein